MKKSILILALLAALIGLFASCSNNSGTSPSQTPGATAASGAEQQLVTITPGKLTIATGEPAWEPWVLNDAPESGEGFEAALAYAIADKLGFAKADVVWVRTGFEEAIQPGPKNFDFNLQQYSVTAERKAIIDFSSIYYREPLAVIVASDGPYADAATIAELKDALFGAASADIAYEYTVSSVAPTQEVAVFNDLAAVAQALKAGQIDAMVAGATTADYILYSEQVENGIVIGTLPGSEEATDGLALLLEKDSPLTSAVSKAIDELNKEGKLAEIADKYLTWAEVPVLK